MQQVVIVQYDAKWPQAFERASAEIGQALSANQFTIHHIGSTSIPGMDAKPVIDMLGVATQIETVDEQNDAMAPLGYEALGEFGIPTRRYFRRNNAAGVRTHQLHVFPQGSPHVRRHLAFRDFLRAHPQHASEYAALKRSLAALHPHDIEAYMDGKDAFIQSMQARALIWLDERESTGARGCV